MDEKEKKRKREKDTTTYNLHYLLRPVFATAERHPQPHSLQSTRAKSFTFMTNRPSILPNYKHASEQITITSKQDPTSLYGDARQLPFLPSSLEKSSPSIDEDSPVDTSASAPLSATPAAKTDSLMESIPTFHWRKDRYQELKEYLQTMNFVVEETYQDVTKAVTVKRLVSCSRLRALVSRLECLISRRLGHLVCGVCFRVQAGTKKRTQP